MTWTKNYNGPKTITITKVIRFFKNLDWLVQTNGVQTFQLEILIYRKDDWYLYHLEDDVHQLNSYSMRSPTDITPYFLFELLGQGKKTKLPVSSYFDIYGWGVILGEVRVNERPIGL